MAAHLDLTPLGTAGLRGCGPLTLDVSLSPRATNQSGGQWHGDRRDDSQGEGWRWRHNRLPGQRLRGEQSDHDQVANTDEVHSSNGNLRPEEEDRERDQLQGIKPDEVRDT